MEPIFVQYDEELLEHNDPFFALSEWQRENEEYGRWGELPVVDDELYAILENDRKNHQ